jgi:hypothetical protein
MREGWGRTVEFLESNVRTVLSAICVASSFGNPSTPSFSIKTPTVIFRFCFGHGEVRERKRTDASTDAREPNAPSPIFRAQFERGGVARRQELLAFLGTTAGVDGSDGVGYPRRGELAASATHTITDETIGQGRIRIPSHWFSTGRIRETGKEKRLTL